MGLRIGIGLLYATSFVTIFYGVTIFRAALMTYNRFLRRNRAILPDHLRDFAVAEDVARQGLLYGLAIIAVGLAVFAVGRSLQRCERGMG